MKMQCNRTEIINIVASTRVRVAYSSPAIHSWAVPCTDLDGSRPRYKDDTGPS